MPTTRETILAALHARLQPLAATVLRDEVLPERIPPAGLIILRDGQPGEPEVTLSPLRYHFQHRAELEVIVQGANDRATAFDTLMMAIGTALTTDRTLGGLCDWVEAEAPASVDLPVDGAVRYRVRIAGTDQPMCCAGCAAVAEEFGPIDIVVNNAGITRDGTLHKMSFDDWNEVMRINLGGCFNMAKATFPGMRERGWGRIVNIGSINGQAGQYGQVNYAAAKSGIHGFTKALAQEGAKFGVTVNAIAPGYIDTDMVAAVPAPVLEKIVAKIPVGRLGEPEEIARCVAFLAADDAGFITGSTLSINGGQHMY